MSSISSVIAGFGGQGVLSAGKILAYAALCAGKEASWMPSYGPEQRGGTANATVIVGDERISSPIVSMFDAAVVLNQQSLNKFEPRVKKGGLLIYDSMGITVPPTRTDVQVVAIDAACQAKVAGSIKASNMVMLGALIGCTLMFNHDSISDGLKHVLPLRHHNMISVNVEAFSLGFSAAQQLAICG